MSCEIYSGLPRFSPNLNPSQKAFLALTGHPTIDLLILLTSRQHRFSETVATVMEGVSGYQTRWRMCAATQQVRRSLISLEQDG